MPDKVYAIFKPYRFTMVNYLQDEYATAFKDADQVVITELYGAGEDPIPGIDSRYLAGKIETHSGKKADYIKELEDVPAYLLEQIKPDDLVIFFGGDDLFAIAKLFGEGLLEVFNQS